MYHFGSVAVAVGPQGPPVLIVLLTYSWLVSSVDQHSMQLTVVVVRAVVCGCRVAGAAVANAGTLQLQSALTASLRHILSGQALTAAQQAQLAAAASTAAASGATAAGAGERHQQQLHGISRTAFQHRWGASMRICLSLLLQMFGTHACVHDIPSGPRTAARYCRQSDHAKPRFV